ncbi:MAG: hypothetical protein ACTSR9_19155 [Candidatus Thorarchaeota archaeon]
MHRRRQLLQRIDRINKNHRCIPLPQQLIGKFHNACTDPCDMVDGPCACGAAHHIQDWPDEVIEAVWGDLKEELKE